MTSVIRAPNGQPEEEQPDSPLFAPVHEEDSPVISTPDYNQLPNFRLRRINGNLPPRSRLVAGLASEELDTARNRSSSMPLQTSDIAQPSYPSLSSRRSTADGSNAAKAQARKELLRLSTKQIEELTSPESLPIRRDSPVSPTLLDETPGLKTNGDHVLYSPSLGAHLDNRSLKGSHLLDGSSHLRARQTSKIATDSTSITRRPSNTQTPNSLRPQMSRAVSIPHPSTVRRPLPEDHRALNHVSKRRPSHGLEDPPSDLDLRNKQDPQASLPSPPPSPIPDTIPLPPLSLPTHLHLELADGRPSPLYIHHNYSSDTPYESTRVKFERLLNFILLPPHLERCLLFGALTCLDAWLYTFTLLPLRFLKALWILLRWTAHNLWREVNYISEYVYGGIGRVWHRRKRKSSMPSDYSSDTTTRRSSEAVDPTLNDSSNLDGSTQQRPTPLFRRRLHHHRPKPTPSPLRPTHKADLLQGLLIVTACTLLMRFDASRMYHAIRGQAAIKLYVIYNVLEVCDRLFSSLGADITECLFSAETLSRKADGRSKVIRPVWMFGLALVYTVCHATAFFYQVITLNVAVNSYSNALLTLLMSNQFLEIKSTVFKKFEKENLFQLTCADVVERFQLWLMLLIIALRNIVELGGLSLWAPSTSSASSSSTDFPPSSASGPSFPNSTSTTTTSSSGFSALLPHAFTLLPSPATSFQLLSPFIIVLGIEMLVDWLKHAYVSKFNAVSPTVYGRFLDVLAKDYYSNSFEGNGGIVKRLGLPVVPLGCLFLRSCVQTWQMFLATNISAPSASFAHSTGAGIASTALEDPETSASASPALAQIDHIFRNALGRSSFGGGAGGSDAARQGRSWFTAWTLDDIIALTTMLVFFLAVYFLLLAFKLLLGMILLSLARERYKGMEERKKEGFIEKEARKTGAYGGVEVGEGRRRVFYEGDEERYRRVGERERKRERERDEKERDRGKGDKLDGVGRYDMVAKRIW